MFGLVEIIGLIAGLLYSTSTISQTIKMIRLKDGRAVSTITYAMQTMALILWLVYGIMHGLPLFVFWTVIAILFTGSVLVLKLFVWKG